jgi:mono/diheme cytochrome c family protein
METRPLREPRRRGRLAGAFLAAALALTFACGVSRALRGAAARLSHQQPTAEAWFEVQTPTTPGLVRQGRALFLNSCAHCHGADATGDEGPDLHGLEVSDRYIANIIARGIRGEMPSFRKKLGRADVLSLTSYLRSLSQGSSLDAQRANPTG